MRLNSKELGKESDRLTQPDMGTKGMGRPVPSGACGERSRAVEGMPMLQIYLSFSVARAIAAKKVASSQNRTMTCGSDQPLRWKW